MAAPNRTAPSTVAARLAALRQRVDLRLFMHLGAWGGAALAALVLALIVGRTPLGSARLSHIFSSTHEPQVVAAVPASTKAETEELHELARQVARLAADRERLQERLTSLEHDFEDLTGSIKAVTQANAAAHNAPAPMAEKEKMPEKVADKEKVANKEQKLSPLPQPAAPTVVPVPASTTTTPPPAASAAAPSKDEVPMPQARVASAPPAITPESVMATDQFGIDLGGGANTEALRERWAMLKANFGPLLIGLHPRAAPHQHKGVTDYRLVLGPLSSFGVAVRLCNKFNNGRAPCHAARFTGADIAVAPP